MKHFIIVIAVMSMHLACSAQSDFGIKVNAGVSKLTTRFGSTNSGPYASTQKFYFMFSGHGGFFYGYHFGEKSILGSELLFIQVNGKERQATPVLDQSGNFTGELVTDDFWRNISYIGVPVYYGYQIGKFSVNLGAQVNFAVKSSGREKGQRPDGNDGIITWENEADKLDIDMYDYGIRAGFTYDFTDRLSLEANYYFGLNDILSRDFLFRRWNWKVQQGTIGVRYKFISASHN